MRPSLGGATTPKAKRSRQARAKAEEFQQYIQAEAGRRMRSAGVTGKLDRAAKRSAMAEVFRARPRYSTRQKVRPEWGMRQSRTLGTTR